MGRKNAFYAQSGGVTAVINATSYDGLCAILRLVVHLCALEERMIGPRYDVFGPWPVCPDHIVQRYL